MWPFTFVFFIYFAYRVLIKRSTTELMFINFVLQYHCVIWTGIRWLKLSRKNKALRDQCTRVFIISNCHFTCMYNLDCVFQLAGAYMRQWAGISSLLHNIPSPFRYKVAIRHCQFVGNLAWTEKRPRNFVRNTHIFIQVKVKPKNTSCPGPPYLWRYIIQGRRSDAGNKNINNGVAVPVIVTCI